MILRGMCLAFRWYRLWLDQMRLCTSVLVEQVTALLLRFQRECTKIRRSDDPDVDLFSRRKQVRPSRKT